MIDMHNTLANDDACSATCTLCQLMLRGWQSSWILKQGDTTPLSAGDSIHDLPSIPAAFSLHVPRKADDASYQVLIFDAGRMKINTVAAATGAAA